MNAIYRDEILFGNRQLMSYGNLIFLLLGGEPKRVYITALAVAEQGGVLDCNEYSGLDFCFVFFFKLYI